MVKWPLLFSLLFSLLFCPMVAQAKQRDFHALAAFSTNFSFPGSIRVGWGQWELGRLTPFAYGFDKIFDLTDHTYTSFGFAASSNLGLYGGVGFSYSWYGFGIRGELTTVFDASGFSQGLGILGVTYGF
jgi:hypothetical protein